MHLFILQEFSRHATIKNNDAIDSEKNLAIEWKWFLVDGWIQEVILCDKNSSITRMHAIIKGFQRLQTLFVSYEKR